jgi:hypothetical protein
MKKTSSSNQFSAMAILIMFLALITGSGCQKTADPQPASYDLEIESKASEPFLPNNQDQDLHPTTLKELQQARAATAKYKDIRHAIEDGYVDINVPIINMGHHFLNMSLRNDGGLFEVRKPELLVYDVHKMPDGTLEYELGAVEYAIPIINSPNAPEGFFGDNDEWTKNTRAGVWNLHAWVWKYNPNGVFAPLNPDVFPHVH